MQSSSYKFNEVTLLITHYNRSASLDRLLKAFEDLNCKFGDIVVSDDGSKTEHLQQLELLQQKYNFNLQKTPQNRGLGNNINKGQDAVNTPYTLYVQEDFVPTSIFPGYLSKAFGFMQEDRELDYIRFYAYEKYPYLLPFKDGFSQVNFKKWQYRYKKIYAYSDHPHLRRSNFLTKFGRYPEGLKGDKTEYRMCISFLQKKGKALFFNEYKSLFTQENSASEPSTMTRSKLTQSSNPAITVIRNLYRQVKYNYDILFMKL